MQSDFQLNKATAKNTAFHTIDRQMKRFIRIIEKKDLEIAFGKIGFDTNDIQRLRTTCKKPKTIWDYFFFTSNKDLIASRQYRRNFVIERKENYLKYANELNNYDKFVETAMLCFEQRLKKYPPRTIGCVRQEMLQKLRI